MRCLLASTGSRVCFDVAASLCCCCNSCRAWGGWREGSDNSCCASVGVVVKLGGTLMLRFMQGGGRGSGVGGVGGAGNARGKRLGAGSVSGGCIMRGEGVIW